MAAEVIEKLLIKNELGLHARAAANFVKTASQYDCEVSVRKNGAEANGRSITSLIMLAAGKGVEIEIKIHGVDAHDCMKTIKTLIDNNFGEDR